MKKLITFLLWIIVCLLLVSISNYFLNKQFYTRLYDFIEIALGTVGLLTVCYVLASIANYKKNKLMFGLLFVFFYILLFISLSEFLIYKYSGVAFVEQSFLHFELASLMIGFAIYPVKYTSVVLCIALLSFVLIRYIPSKQMTKRSFIVLFLALTVFFFNGYGTSLGRLFLNYKEFKYAQNLDNLSFKDILPYKKFGIQPVVSKAFMHVEPTSEKKNLIIVYLESFSREFVNNDKYPNLTPEINHLIQEYGEFENYHSTAKFTMQGLISSLCGLAPKLNSGNNISEDQLPYKNLPCLSDVLHKAGYQQEFVGGARKNFSNKEAFLKNKQFDQVWGWTDYNKPKDYQTNDWGLQDGDLFDFAFQKINQLNQSNKPFHVSILTLATHLDGNPDPRCPKYDPENNHHKFINGIHCTDYLLGQFIKNLQKENLLKNTTVLITSDHGVFPVGLIKELFGKNFDRNKLFGLLIDNYQFDKSLPLGLYDIPAIIVESLGVNTNVEFINGRKPGNISKDRFILRENVLTLFKPSVKKECNQTGQIEKPIDPCENQQLLQINWGYGATFNSSDDQISLESVKFTANKDSSKQMVELFINDQEQTNKFLVEGYPISKHERLANSHLFILVYDLNTHKVLSRNALNLNKDHWQYFNKYWNPSDNSTVFIFTENISKLKDAEQWNQIIEGIGSKKLLHPNKNYFGIYSFNNNKTKVKEWEFNSKDSPDLIVSEFEGH